MSAGKVFEYTTSGTYVSSFISPGIHNFGMTWDGNDLWVSDQEHDIIYQVELIGVLWFPELSM